MKGKTLLLNDCSLSERAEICLWSRLSELLLEGCRTGHPAKYSGKRQCSSRRHKRDIDSLLLSQRWSLLASAENAKPSLELTGVGKVRDPEQWNTWAEMDHRGGKSPFCIIWWKSNSKPTKARRMLYWQSLRSLLLVVFPLAYAMCLTDITYFLLLR